MIRRRLPSLVLVAVALAVPASASAQFEEPCELACIGVLGATSFITATGAAIGVGRATGGLSTVNQGLLIWGGTFAGMLGGGMGLSGDGSRQERAVYGAGLGMLAGAATGFLLEAVRTDGDGPRVLAGTLIGASLGAIAAGIYGAVSYEKDESAGSVPLLSLSLHF